MASMMDTESSHDDDRDVVVDNLLHIVVGGKALLIRSSEIREVVRPTPLTRVPMGPEHVIGLTNIHGQIVCVIDIGGVTTLSSCHRQQTSRTRFLILRHPRMHAGIWADEVCSIKPVDAALLTAAAESGESVAQVEIEGARYELFECACLFK